MSASDPMEMPDPPVDPRVDQYRRRARPALTQHQLPGPKPRTGVPSANLEGCWPDHGTRAHIRIRGKHAPMCRTNMRSAGVGIRLDIGKVGCWRCLVELRKRGGIKGVVRSVEAIERRLAELGDPQLEPEPGQEHD